MELLREGRDFPTVRRELRDGEFAEPTDQERARVIQGVTVLLEDRAEVDVLEALVGQGLHEGWDYGTLYEAVGSLDWKLAFWREGARGVSERRDELLEMIPDEPDKVDPLQALFLALNATREIWEAADDAKNLNVTLSLVPPSYVVSSAIWFWIWCWVWLWMMLNPFFLWIWMWLWKPFSPPEAELVSFREPKPVFTLAPGSCETLLGVMKALWSGKWILTTYSTVRGTFTSAAEAAQWFVDELRKSQKSNKQTRFPDLERMDKLDKQDLQAKPVIVLVHGTFSTDVGTFDGLLEEWEKIHKPSVESGSQQVKFVGYPHNSLQLIAYNAEDLADLIDEKLGKDNQKILFVCHSRGGLVARATVNELLKRGGRWRDRLAGCVTFGTPHEGARLASSPLREVAAYVRLSLGTKSVIALDKVLVYLHHEKRIDGLDDLAPPDNPVSEFLVRLKEHEKKRDGPDGPKNVVAIGGDVTRQPVRGLLFRKIAAWLGRITGQHDLVVETSSSVPDWVEESKGKCVNVDHFHYFEEPESTKFGLEGICSLLASKSPSIERPAPFYEKQLHSVSGQTFPEAQSGANPGQSGLKAKVEQ